RQGNCKFANLAAGEWVISVETENLLATVEHYKSRNEQTPSPVESRAESELGAVHQNRKKYALVSVGDLWSTPPQDSFLTEH
ncbi:lipase, partial [Vibrio brasiliensis]